jgi:hypothetical protein
MWTASRNAPRATRARCPLATWRRFLGSRSGLGCGFIIGYLLRVVGHEYALRQCPRMSGTRGHELRASGLILAELMSSRCPRVKRAACPYARPRAWSCDAQRRAPSRRRHRRRQQAERGLQALQGLILPTRSSPQLRSLGWRNGGRCDSVTAENLVMSKQPPIGSAVHSNGHPAQTSSCAPSH